MVLVPRWFAVISHGELQIEQTALVKVRTVGAR